MADEKTAELVKAVAEFAKVVPLYQDAIQPGAKELGKALGSVGRAGNALLLPIMELVVVWGEEKVRPFCQRIGKKLDAIPQEHRSPPNANVVGPALEAVRNADGEADLQDMYANLIASSMDKRVVRGVLPSFVEILKQLSSDEAKILGAIKKGPAVPIVHIQQVVVNDAGVRTSGLDVEKNQSLIGEQAGCEYPEQAPAYLDNLARLGIVRFLANGTHYADQSLYRGVELDPRILALREQYEKPPRYRTKYVQTGLELTTFGRAFIRSCVQPYDGDTKHVGTPVVDENGEGPTGIS